MARLLWLTGAVLLVQGCCSDPVTYYVDDDGDGYGDPGAATVNACDGPADYVDNADDCDDTDPAINPNADFDGDGVYACDDCDDTNADRYPGNTEVCDDIDNDCNTLVDDAAADATNWYIDDDGDGWGDADPVYALTVCDQPDGYVDNAGDCDDLRADTYPDAPEACDGVDNDCDGEYDEESANRETFYADNDGDGYGDPNNPSLACEQPAGHVADASDCDDSDAAINVKADEVCDDVDNDCDGLVDDEDDLVVSNSGSYWWVDNDRDGFGCSDDVVYACDQPAGFEDDRDDCDDGDDTVHPDASEICNEIDDDCDGLIDDDDPSVDTSTGSTFYADADEDGYGDVESTTEACLTPSGYVEDDTDCDDEDSSIYPDAWDWWNDGVDGNCDGDDNTEMDLADAPITIEGASGTKSYVGLALDVCDLDGDGIDDLIVSAPELPYSSSTAFNGAIGVFYGSGSSGWSDGMAMSDADVLIQAGPTSHFFGTGTRCADLNGDGYLDLVTARGEYNLKGYSSYRSTFGVLGFYGTLSGWSSTIADSAKDFEYSYTLGVVDPTGIVYSRALTVGDLDGDDKSEIIVNMSTWGPYHGPDDYSINSLWFLQGGSYSGTGALEDYVATLDGDSDDGWLYPVRVVEDFDGDGYNDVFVTEFSSSADTYPVAGLLSDPLGDDGYTTADLYHTTWQGTGSGALGYDGLISDLNGDGVADAVLSAPLDSSGVTSGGGLYVFEDVPALVGEYELAESDADGHVYGDTSVEAYFSYPGLEAVGDFDGDGFVDLLVSDDFSGDDRVNLVSGASLWDPTGVAADDASLMVFASEGAGYRTGWHLASGDFDDDGVKEPPRND